MIIDSKSVIFMDFENIYWSMKRQYNHVPEPGRLIEGLRDWASRFGYVCMMQAYADFDNEEFHGLLSELQRRSVEPRHVFSKNYEDGTRKNAADIEMSLDALELMYNRPDVSTFVLVCGDRDMIQVIRKLKGRGKQVYVTAVEKAMSKDLIAFANGFTTVEQLLGVTAPAGQSPDTIVRRLHGMEGSMPFVGLKYFMKVLSGSDQSDQRVYDLVNKAIADDIVRTYQVPNPHDERFPTTACRLNLEHDLVRRLLGPVTSGQATLGQGPSGQGQAPSGPAITAPGVVVPGLVPSHSHGAAGGAGKQGGPCDDGKGGGPCDDGKGGGPCADGALAANLLAPTGVPALAAVAGSGS